MFANVITVTQGELLSGSVYKTITDRVFTYSESNVVYTKYYRPVGIQFKNSTGGSIHFLPMTTIEKNVYEISGSAISDLIPVANNESFIIEKNIKNEITHILVSGTSGHNSSLSIIVLQE